MQTLTQALVDSGLAERVLSESQLRRVVSGSDQRRYHLVNRAQAAGELIRLRRGRYVLADTVRRSRPHPFALAQALAPGSYVSFESALAHHGWIPEGVTVVASVSSQRKAMAVDHKVYGNFSFAPLRIEPSGFLLLVERVEFASDRALVARPARALMDLVSQRKLEWQGSGWLTDGLRIEAKRLRTISGAELRSLGDVYRETRVLAFIDALSRELGND